ncbi:unnamed protein product [[Candida] boidinii]|nr:unnamed protein product [[Candida] boidinii]
MNQRDLEEWPFRYLGMHAKLEDALDLQDRPYARAASRLGSKHQFTGMVDWFDHPVVYYDKLNGNNGSANANGGPYNKKKKYIRKSESPSPSDNNNSSNNASDTALMESLEAKKLPIPDEYKDINPKEFPPWLQPRPKGYIERGGDETVDLNWKQPESAELQERVENYIKDCEKYAKNLNILANTPNFVDAILKSLLENNYDDKAAVKEVELFTRESLREPTFSKDEIKRFENSVRINGSELFPVFKDVGTQTCAMVVRFYYLWKKTKNGHLIWDNYEGRAKNKIKKAIVDNMDIANTDDDSSYNGDKINKKKIHFECKYCKNHNSTQWYKVTGSTPPQDKDQPYIGLCIRCAKIWRRYAVIWEDPNEVLKKQTQKGNSGWKRRVETELTEDALLITEARDNFKARQKKLGISTHGNSSLVNSQNSASKSRASPSLENSTDIKSSDSSKKPTKGKNSNKKLTTITGSSSSSTMKKTKSGSVKKYKTKKSKAEQSEEVDSEIEDDEYDEDVDMDDEEDTTNSIKEEFGSDDGAYQDRGLYHINNETSEAEANEAENEEDNEEQEEGKDDNSFIDYEPSNKPKNSKRSLKSKEVSESKKNKSNGSPSKVSVSATKLRTLKLKKNGSKVPKGTPSAVIHSNISESGDPSLTVTLQYASANSTKKKRQLPENDSASTGKRSETENNKKAKTSKKTDLSKDVVSGNATNANGVSNGGNKISGKLDKVNSDKLLEAQSRMVERYSSDYENFNPILQPSFANPLYQVRAASEEINLIYKVQSWKNDGNNANNNPGASQSVLKSLHVPLFHPSKRACCVCREEGEIEQMLICSNCGMNTHANCYGASLESFNSSELPSNYKWYCDSCSNDLHPIYSTHYVCCLCTAKEVDYDSAIRGDKCSVPDSFKRTDSNRWCHAICSIFNEDCKYKDTSSMQPVIGTDLTILKNVGKSCGCCGIGAGGLTKCDLCEETIHVTCALDSTGYFVGFKLDKCDIKDKNCVKIRKTGVYGKPRPIIICKDHKLNNDDESLYSRI